MAAEATTTRDGYQPTPRLRNVVDAYLASQRFPTSAHPSFDTVATATRASWIAAFHRLPSATSHQARIDDTVSFQGTVKDDGDTPMYACDHKCKASMLTRHSDDLYKDADLRRATFEQALIQYERSAPDKAKTHINVQSNHSWEDLLDVVDRALKSYEDTSGFSGRMRKVLRRLSSQTEMLSAWSEFLPSGSEYFSILCGGLKMIIMVSFPDSARPNCANNAAGRGATTTHLR